MERASKHDLYVPLVEARVASASPEVAEVRVRGLRTPTWKAVLYVTLCVLTVGVFFLLSRWILRLRVAVLYTSCGLDEADHVLVEEAGPSEGEVADERTEFVEEVVALPDRRYFVHKGLRHVYEEERFVCLEYPVAREDFATIHRRGAAAPSDEARAELHARFGPNKMDVPSPSVVELLVDELLHPFYIFQIVSVVIWIMQFYFIYAGTIFVLATAALIFSVVQTRSNNEALAAMAAHSSTVNVARQHKTVMVDSKQLVPGDLVLLEAAPVACDMIVLEGEVVVNEASLTGESVPVVKGKTPSFVWRVCFLPLCSLSCLFLSCLLLSRHQKKKRRRCRRCSRLQSPTLTLRRIPSTCSFAARICGASRGRRAGWWCAPATTRPRARSFAKFSIPSPACFPFTVTRSSSSWCSLW